jgi:outer membrane protein TolC
MNLKAFKKLAAGLSLVVVTVSTLSAQTAQTRNLGLDEAVQLGIQNSKQLKKSQYKIDEALTRVDQAKDDRLPSAKVSFQYLHALMLARTVSLPGSKDPIHLPFDLPAYVGQLSVSEPIFAGNKLKYARQSAELMVQMGRMDWDKDKEDITYLIINSYINYNKILQNQLIVAQNIQDIQTKLDEITKYEGQGLATKNDVLRYQLQKSQMQLTVIELENNRQIANYNMNVLLGLPDSTQIILPAVSYKLDEHPVFTDLLQTAETNRRELQDLSYQSKLSDINVKKIHDQRLPTVTATAGAYYINPTGNPIPHDHALIAPVTLGVGASWDIATLYTNKNKEREASLQRQELNTDREQAMDNIRKEVNRDFLLYHQSLEKIKVLQEAVSQAEENERITESKFQNNLVNTTDRIDAQTLLYSSRVNLELAKSDATIAWYDMLRSTGKIHL